MGIRDQAHRDPGALGLISTGSTQWEEEGSQDPKPQLPQGPGLRPLPALPSTFLILEKE